MTVDKAVSCLEIDRQSLEIQSIKFQQLGVRSHVRLTMTSPRSSRGRSTASPRWPSAQGLYSLHRAVSHYGSRCTSSRDEDVHHRAVEEDTNIPISLYGSTKGNFEKEAGYHTAY